MNIDLLRALCETPGVPGREDRVRNLITREIKGLFDDVETDAMGNLICRRTPTKKPKGEVQRVMLACHMDEIGFFVSYIDSEGFIYVDPVGGFDQRNLFSRRVKICTNKGDFPGVMNPGGRPLHISTPEDRKKIPELSEFVIDTGLGKDTQKKIQIGDFVVMDEPLVEMGDKIVSKALDNRIACWLGIEVIRKLVADKSKHECEVWVAFTSQEEVGLRGARTSAYRIKPHIGFGIDVTLSCDTPGVPKQDAVTIQGEGFGLHVKDSSFISDIKLIEEVEALAKKKKIPSQRTILRAGGQDGAAAQQAAAGARAIGIVVGTRYIHTVTEMIAKSDLIAARDILAAWIAEN